MDDTLSAILSTPQTTILTIAGILFLLLAVAGSVVGKIHVPPERQKWAGIIGGFLLLAGILIPTSKPDSLLHGTVVSGVTPSAELKVDLERVSEMIKESIRKENTIRARVENDSGDDLKKQQEETEKLKATMKTTERLLKQRIAVSELKHEIMKYYSAQSDWAGTFVIERIDKLVIKGNTAHVRYKYSPIQGNKSKRSDSGYDERTFGLQRVGDKYRVVSMGGYMSARF